MSLYYSFVCNNPFIFLKKELKKEIDDIIKAEDRMDANTKRINHIRVKNTIANLEKNNIEAVYVETKEEALTLFKTMVPNGANTASGGSMTLRDTGIYDYLLSDTDYHKEYKDAYSASYYVLSANAITEKGEIYQVDGRSNRVSAMLFGPENVIVVAGINKLVPSLRDAAVRVKNITAPMNATRLCMDTPCTKLGHCISPSVDDDNLFASGCLSEGCICCNSVVFRYQRAKNRIKVIIVGEDLGY